MSGSVRPERFVHRAVLLVAALAAALCIGAQPQNSSYPAQQPQSAASTDASQPAQPMSLADLARAARARKAAQPKAIRIFNDENMPHAPLSAGDKAPGVSGQGKVTLIDFWATWCGPCRQALPELKQLDSVYRSDEFELISVNEDDDESTWSAFTARNGMIWTQRFDSAHQMMRQYGATGLPTYVLVGRDGTVLQQYVGEDPQIPVVERIGPDLKKALAGKS
ncbi:MAG TPA: TlpA disulfide reductase family protein [Candidatus Limnocylindrales bacterium]|nr:TlpA disulfide reductase family protein [Candidatus Limnocylindrales bacterium]